MPRPHGACGEHEDEERADESKPDDPDLSQRFEEQRVRVANEPGAIAFPSPQELEGPRADAGQRLVPRSVNHLRPVLIPTVSTRALEAVGDVCRAGGILELIPGVRGFAGHPQGEGADDRHRGGRAEANRETATGDLRSRELKASEVHLATPDQGADQERQPQHLVALAFGGRGR
jgi:hypothetical protein